MSNLAWHRGDWMQTYTGRKFYPMDAREEDIDIVDIAHSLSMQCRYNGHVKRFYSVAEHCVLMSRVVPHEFALWALLHDATEAYVGDMVRPLKLHMPAFCDVEDRLMLVIARRFGLTDGHQFTMVTDRGDLDGLRMPVEVKAVDTRILLDERRALLDETLPWSINAKPLGITIPGWDPAIAKWEYLARFQELTGTEVAA